MELAFAMHESFKKRDDIIEVIGNSFEELAKGIDREEKMFVHLLFGNDDPGVEMLASVFEDRNNEECATMVRRDLGNHPGIFVGERYGKRVVSITVKVMTIRDDNGKKDFPVDALISILADAFVAVGIIEMDLDSLDAFKRETLDKCFERCKLLPCIGLIEPGGGVYSQVLSRDELATMTADQLKKYFFDTISTGGVAVFSNEPARVEKFSRLNNLPPKRSPYILFKNKELLKQVKEETRFTFNVDTTIGVMIRKGDDNKDTLHFISDDDSPRGTEELASFLVVLCQAWLRGERATISYFF
jgi:hypothetical protein